MPPPPSAGRPALIDAAPAVWADLGGDGDRLLSETFTPPTRVGHRRRRDRDPALPAQRPHRARSPTGTLLEQAEAAGLTPEFGCRMGICHTCTCRKAAGAVRNLLTGEVSDEEDEDIQLCISRPGRRRRA